MWRWARKSQATDVNVVVETSLECVQKIKVPNRNYLYGVCKEHFPLCPSFNPLLANLNETDHGNDVLQHDGVCAI